MLQYSTRIPRWIPHLSNQLGGRNSPSYMIHYLTSEFHVKFHAKNRYRTSREAMSAISVFLFDSQSERGFTFSYAILNYIPPYEPPFQAVSLQYREYELSLSG